MKNRRHRLWITLNATTAMVLATALVLMINYLSFRHYHRMDLSKAQRYSLSEKTVSLLENLKKPVSATVFFKENNVLYEDIHNLLREYSFKAPNLTINWIDPDRDIARAEEMITKYGIKELNVVVFECEGRTDYARTDEIAQINASTGVERIVAFSGEEAFSSSILGVYQETKPVVYFLTGHGECDLKNFDKRTGFSGLANLIERDNIEIRPLLLSVDKQIPEDCSALVVAGASKSMSKPEADLIGNWLRRSGRLLYLGDARQTSGLEEELFNWGIKLRNDIVLDPSRTMTGREVFVSAYNKHPITAKLSNTAARFILPRSVSYDPDLSKKGAQDRPVLTPLALSSIDSWSETQLDQNPAKFDEHTGDLRGPLAMAVSVEKGGTSGKLDMQIRPSRIVVFGDSGFVSNSGLTGGDTSLFMSSLNWLVDREQLMAIAPKTTGDNRLILEKNDLSRLFLYTTIIIPSLAAFFGIILWIMRRK